MSASRGPHNRFAVGDRVISYRKETAVVTHIYPSADWKSKSHKVSVKWDAQPNLDDRTAYYEEVFDPWEGE